jgi:hypothetical protein
MDRDDAGMSDRSGSQRNAEEGATQATPTEDRPGYEPERPVGDPPTATAPVAATAPLADERDPGLAAEPVVDRETYTPGTSEVVAEPVVDQALYQEGVYDQEADQARQQRPSDGP